MVLCDGENGNVGLDSVEDLVATLQLSLPLSSHVPDATHHFASPPLSYVELSPSFPGEASSLFLVGCFPPLRCLMLPLWIVGYRLLLGCTFVV